MYTDRFGSLQEEVAFRSSRAAVSIVHGFRDAADEFDRRTSRDGFIYPNLVCRSADPGEPPTSWNLHRLPATHRLVMPGVTEERRVARAGAGGLVIHVLGLVYGRRCQFWDWWFDGRVSARESSLHPRPKDVPRVVDQALSTWESWKRAPQVVTINALYLHGRTNGYPWNWEHFQAEYQVFDALYYVARECHGIRARGRVPHPERFKAVHDWFGIAFDPVRVKQIVDARNDLLHQALWSGSVLNQDHEKTLPYAHWLHRLNVRLSLAVLSVETPFVRSAWWLMGSHPFLVP